VPTLVLYGDSDIGAVVTHDAARRATAINSNIVTVHIPGAGHQIRREKFEPFVSTVLDFLHSES